MVRSNWEMSSSRSVAEVKWVNMWASTWARTWMAWAECANLPMFTSASVGRRLMA
jgi:hypothetical protein